MSVGSLPLSVYAIHLFGATLLASIDATIAILEKKINKEEKENLINNSIKELKIALKN